MLKPLNIQSILNAIPVPCVALLPDSPRFTVVEVNEAFLKAHRTDSTVWLNRSLPEAFGLSSTDAAPLKASLDQVLATRRHHAGMLSANVGSEKELTCYAFDNAPVLNEQGDVDFIIHTQTGKRFLQEGASNGAEYNALLSKNILDFERQIYELNTNPEIPFIEVLKTLLKSIELLIDHSYCSILRLNRDDTIQNVAGPSLPPEYMRSIDGLKIGPSAGSCGTAMYTGQNVIVSDVEHDARWTNYLKFIQPYGLKACWSVPVKGRDGKVIGSFATYHKEIKQPAAHELDLIERAAKVVGVLIENRTATEEIRIAKERYDIVSKATSDTIWDWDLLSNKIQWNKGINEVFGYSTTEVGDTMAWWYERVHPDDIERMALLIKDHIENRIPHREVEYRFRSADGNYRHVLDRSFLVVNRRGLPERMIGAMQDFTWRKHEEERLKLLESVITNTTDAVMITNTGNAKDPDPRIVYVNDAFCHMTGYAQDEVLGKSPLILNGPRTDPAEVLRLKNAMLRHEACEIEIVHYKKNQDPYWAQIAVAPVTDTRGKLTHFIAIERDVSQLMQHMQSIKEQNAKLKDIAWTQNHIVRAPLARIMGLIDILSRLSAEDIAKDNLLKHIQDSAHELDRAIKDIVKKTSELG